MPKQLAQADSLGTALWAAGEALSIACAVLDDDGVVVDASPLFARWIGTAIDTCIGNSFAEHLHPGDRPGFTVALHDAARWSDSEAATYVWRVAGAVGPSHVRAALRPLAGAASRYALVLAEHATDRNAVDALADGGRMDGEQVALRMVFDKLPVAVIVGRNSDRRWLYVNGMFTLLTGYTLDDVSTTFEWYERAYPDREYRARWLADYEARRSAAMAKSGDYISDAHNTYIVCKDGSQRFIQTTAFPFQETTIAVLVDLSEHKALENSLLTAREAAEQANRAKSRFLANMSHEIRTPMNAVMGFAQLCAMQPNLNDRMIDYLGIIVKAGDHLLNLINGVLDMSQIESGRIAIDSEPFDLPALLADTYTLLEARARAKGLAFEFVDVDALPRIVLGDAGRIRQIVINIIGNAIKFTSRGYVRVSVTADGGGHRPTDRPLFLVAVEDSGIGIAPEDVERLFQPFEQAGGGRLKEEGTGLGLAISREYARLMDGDITVDSRPGHGSRFVFSVPLHIADTNAKPLREVVSKVMPRGLAPGSKVQRILVVDDREANRLLLASALCGFGFETREAHDGIEAIARFADWSPDAVLLDLHLPGLDGHEVIRRVRSSPAGADTPIVVISAAAFDADRQRVMGSGANAYLTKPIHLAEVFGHLQRLLGLQYV